MLLVCVELWVLQTTPFCADAETWHVIYDPAQPEDRVGAVAAQAASGDVILIDPGTYYEHIPLDGKSLTFIGVGGASGTVLDGERSIQDREGSIIYALTGQAGDLSLEGLTLRNGSGVRVDWLPGDPYAGGAIFWNNRQPDVSGSLTAVDCVFEGNVTGYRGNTWAEGGGAVLAARLASLWIERCSFDRNETEARGGDLLLGAIENATVVDCDLTFGEGGYSGAVSVDYSGGGGLTVQRCSFHGQGPGYPGSTGMAVEAGRFDLLDNRFVDDAGVLATRVLIYCRSCVDPRAPNTGGSRLLQSDVQISGNLFWNPSGADSAADATLLLWWPGPTVTMTGNTLVRCGVGISDLEGSGPPVVFENNIIARGSASFSVPQGGTCSCNDFWRSATSGVGDLTLTNNTSEDPRFCDEDGGQLGLSEGSPCAPEASHGCGLIGAERVVCDLGISACCVGQGCQLLTEPECGDLGGRWLNDPRYTSCDPNPCVTPVTETTWGGVKAMFLSTTR